MVRRTPLLLILAVGCQAESLGVDVPKGGPDAISQEDLQRDAWAFGKGDAGAFEQRLQQMHTLPAFGSSYRSGEVVCGIKDGRSGKSRVIAAEGPAALPRAEVISLAKAWDLPQPPEHSVVLCAWPDGGAAAYANRPAVPLDSTLGVTVLGDLSGPALRATEAGSLGAAPVIHLSTTPAAGAPDYRVVAARVREVYDRVNAASP